MRNFVFYLFLLLKLILQISLLNGQEIPHIQCPKFFQYLRNGNTIFAKVSLYNMNLQTIKIELQFSQQETLNSNDRGVLSLYESQKTTERKLMNGEPIFFRIDFPLLSKPPKLTEIKVNNEIICSAKAHASPRTIWNLQYIFNPSATSPTPTPTPPTSPPPTTECGIETQITVPFIVKGRKIKRGQFPWLTAVYEKQRGDLKFICGGSLISARSILSAAHCFNHTYTLTADRILVYLGRNNLYDYGEDGVENREIETLIIHPEYNANRLSDADIALLRMKVPVGTSRYIRPACLWDGENNINSIIGQKGYVGGWGKDKDETAYSLVPKVVDAKIVSETECRSSSGTYNPLLSPRTFCAGNRDESGPCLGDSGGGLMIIHNGHWTLRGIVSVGQIKYQQCDLEQFVVYCDVAKHISWVHNNM